MIEQFHWGWYLFGLLICPRITFMIFLSYHCAYVPMWLMVLGWIFAVSKNIKWTVTK